MKSAPLDRSAIPEPILDGEAALLALYWTAWELAWQHVVERDGVVQSPYLDEGFDPDTIWIWDTCFMAHFCKYAPEQFPGIESLDNFYVPMYDGAPAGMKIQHPDNPPLFAWAEAEYVRHTGDLARVERILKASYLQKHFAFFDTVPPGSVFDYSRIPTTVERRPRGYRWNGVCSGMDNTPRAPKQGVGGTYGDLLWFDAAAHQALSARSIAELARLVDDSALATEYDAHHARLSHLVNDFWNDADGIYYDRSDHEPFEFHKVRTPAAYWPLLADVCSDDQADALAALLTDRDCFGGPVPWPSVARNDPAFRATGHYWRGGVWVPTAYMSARALADHGHANLAHDATVALLRHMARTYTEYQPATIWEAYAPNAAAPSTAKDDEEISRPDFCGWSALAPISMLIEHVLGFRVDAPSATVRWHRHTQARTGIRRLRCGPVTCDIEATGPAATIAVDGPLTVVIDNASFRLDAGSHDLVL